MLSVLKSPHLRKGVSLLRVCPVLSLAPTHSMLFSSRHEEKDVPAGTIANDVMFDKLVRKPYEKQHYDVEYPSNMKFASVIAKHVLIDTSLVVCSTLGACAICSVMGVLPSSLTVLFDNPSCILNRLFPFLLHISGDSMRYTFELMTMLSPAWLGLATGLSWIGSRVELKKLYKLCEEKNDRLLHKEDVSERVVSNGDSIHFYGDETQHGNGRHFTKESAHQTFYDGYGGDCSYKANKEWTVC